MLLKQICLLKWLIIRLRNLISKTKMGTNKILSKLKLVKVYLELKVCLHLSKVKVISVKSKLVYLAKNRGYLIQIRHNQEVCLVISLLEILYLPHQIIKKWIQISFLQLNPNHCLVTYLETSSKAVKETIYFLKICFLELAF